MKASITSSYKPSWRAYYELCKPRVVALMVITSYVGMVLAAGSQPKLNWLLYLYASCGIALAAAAGGVINQIIDRRIDAIMARTHKRPLPSHSIPTPHAVIQVIILAGLSLGLLYWQVNTTCTLLTLATLLGYGVVYSAYLKRATPQNIVIGGLVGAMPPMLGWSAINPHLIGSGWLLVLIIFLWTPPHFWALAIARRDEYAKANLPMLPITHGIKLTQQHIVLYSILMIISTYSLYFTHTAGLVYALGVSVLNLGFMYQVIRLCRTELHKKKYGHATFAYSISYLTLMFILLLIDHLYYFI